MHDLGGDTRDHITLGIPHPQEHTLPGSEHETHIRQTGTRNIWTGTLLLTAGITTILALLAYSRHHQWDDPVTRQLVGLALILTGLTATALITSGLIERQQRQTRTLIRRAMARADANANLGDANRAAIEKNTLLIAELVYGLDRIEKNARVAAERLATMETAIAKIPDFAEGFSRGAYVTATALGLEKDE